LRSHEDQPGSLARVHQGNWLTSQVLVLLFVLQADRDGTNVWHPLPFCPFAVTTLSLATWLKYGPCPDELCVRR